MPIIDINKISTEISEKYSVVSNSFRLVDIKNPELDKYTKTPKDLITAEIGDVKQTEFLPQIKLARWGDNEEVGEVNFSVRLAETLTGTETVTTEADKIVWDKGNMKAEFYDYVDGDGGYKFVWYLKKKPKTNKVNFTIQSKNLNFFYQPPLTQEYKNGYSEEFQKEIVVTETQVKDLEGNVLVERPENVVGSYVFYHKTKGGMVDAWGKAYGTGRGGIIYRPKLIDANGLEGWGNLDITWTNEEKTVGIYSVEIPQDFLDKAVYPIKSNDTFGYETLGTTGFKVIANLSSDTSSMFGFTANLSVAGTLDSISAGTKCMSLSEAADTFLALYREDSGGSGTHALVASVESLNLAYKTTASYKTINAASEVLSADDYILAALANGVDLVWDRVVVMYDNTNNVNTYTEESTGATSYATRKAENPWTETKTTNDDKLSIYATYTPSGGGATTPTRPMTTNRGWI